MTVHRLKGSRVRRLGIDHGIDEGQVVAGKQPWRGRTEIRGFRVAKRFCPTIRVFVSPFLRNMLGTCVLGSKLWPLFGPWCR